MVEMAIYEICAEVAMLHCLPLFVPLLISFIVLSCTRGPVQAENSRDQDSENFSGRTKMGSFSNVLVFGLIVSVAAIKLVKEEEHQDFSKIPGIAGHDYPIYHEVPETNFDCHNVPFHPGMYANVETGCQAYHVCHDGREGHQGSKFLCTNGTVFNQKLFACDWWYNVNCNEAIEYYKLNLDPELNPYTEQQVKAAKKQGLIYH